MSAFQHKAFVKGFKRRILKKVEDVVEEADNACAVIQELTLSLRKRAECALEEDDDEFSRQYQKLHELLENLSEKLFLAVNVVTSSAEENGTGSEEQTKCHTSKFSQCGAEDAYHVSESQKDSSSQGSNDLPSTDSGISMKSHSNGLEDTGRPLSSGNCQTKTSKKPEHVKDEVDSVKCSELLYTETISSVDKPQQLSTLSLLSNASHCTTSSSDRDIRVNEVLSPSDSKSQSSDQVPCVTDFNKYSSRHSTSSSNSFATANSQLDLKSSGACIQMSLPPPVVPFCTLVNVSMTNYHNPSDFWLCFNLNSPFEEIMKSCKSPKVNLADVNKVKYCMAPSKCNGYVRVEVLSVFGSGANMRVQVFHIDSGNVGIVYASELRLMPNSLYKYPPQAIHCYLNGVVPVNDAWESDAVAEFANAAALSDLQATILYEKGDMFAVQLIVTFKMPDGTDTSDLAEMLCLLGLAVSLEACGEERLSLGAEQCDLNAQECSIQNTSYHSSEFGMQETSSCDPCETEISSRISSHGDSETVVDLSLPNKTGEISQTEFQSYQLRSGQGGEEVYISDDSESQEMTDLSSLCDDDEVKRINLSSDHKSSEEEVMSNNSDQLNEESRFEKYGCDLNVVVPPPEPLFIQEDLMIVLPSVIYSPSYFYCNVSMENSLELDELREQMAIAYKELEDSVDLQLNVTDIRENMYLAAYYENDNCWYRVQVNHVYDVQVGDSQPQAIVLDIDYGSERKVLLKDLRPLKTEFAKYPAMAILCSLAYIKSKSSDSANNESDHFGTNIKWGEKAIEVFDELTKNEKPLTAQVSEFQVLSENRVLYEVFLWLVIDGEEKVINDILVKKGVADYTNLSIIPDLLNWKRSQEDESKVLNNLDVWDPMLADYNDVENSYGVDQTDVGVTTVGHKAMDETYICKYFATNETCFRGDQCPYRHISAGYEDATVDQDFVYLYENPIALPEAGMHCLVQVSCVLTPGHFYVVFPFGASPVSEIQNNPGALIPEQSEFVLLSAAMSEFYSKSVYDENSSVALAYGSIVIAKTKYDGSWCRARITEVENVNRPVEVFFLDFGTTEWVNRRDIRQMQPQFLHCPFQAVETFLANVEPVGKPRGRWTGRAKSSFEKLVKGNTLLAYINRRLGSVLFVTLKLTLKNDMAVINEILVQQGFAESSNSALVSVFREYQYTWQVQNKYGDVVREPG